MRAGANAGAALAVDRAGIISGGLEARLHRFDRVGASTSGSCRQFGDGFAGVGGDRAQQLVRRGGGILRDAPPLIENGRGGVIAAWRSRSSRRACKSRARPTSCRRSRVRRIRPDRRSLGPTRLSDACLQQRVGARQVLFDAVALRQRDGEIDRAVGEAALRRLLVKRVRRLEILGRMVAGFQHQTQAVHRAGVAGVGRLLVERHRLPRDARRRRSRARAERV